jgi:hypothetical protein
LGLPSREEMNIVGLMYWAKFGPPRYAYPPTYSLYPTPAGAGYYNGQYNRFKKKNPIIPFYDFSGR